MKKEQTLLDHLRQFTKDNPLEAYYIYKGAKDKEKLYDIKVNKSKNSITYSYFFFTKDDNLIKRPAKHSMTIEGFFDNYIPRNYESWTEYMFVNKIKRS